MNEFSTSYFTRNRIHKLTPHELVFGIGVRERDALLIITSECIWEYSCGVRSPCEKLEEAYLYGRVTILGRGAVGPLLGGAELVRLRRGDALTRSEKGEVTFLLVAHEDESLLEGLHPLVEHEPRHEQGVPLHGGPVGGLEYQRNRNSGMTYQSNPM